VRGAAIVLALTTALALGSFADAELVQQGRLRVAVDASLAPKRLPRSGLAPVRFAFSARFIESQNEIPPQLRQIRIEINRHGHLDPRGLPSCRIDQIQPATTTNALRACRASLVGEGHFSSKVLFPRQAPFPSDGKVVAFNGRWHGSPAILAHIYGPKPVPTSYTIPFVISAARSGTYGTRLTASLPAFSNKWGYVTAISITLGRSFSSRGHRRSYLSAGCPAPSGIALVNFPLSRTSFAFSGHQKVSSTLVRSCRAGR
jgi:hypothetical protein